MTILEVIERETGQQVTEATPLEDLNADSLEFMDLLLAISNETGMAVPDGQLGKLHVVGDIARVAG